MKVLIAVFAIVAVLCSATVRAQNIPDTVVQSSFYTDEGLVSRQGEYYQVIFFPCSNGTYELSVNIHEQNAAGISLFAYVSTSPNPTKCNYNQGWTTEEWGSAIPRETLAFNATAGRPIYIGLTTGFTTQAATFSISMRPVALTRVKPAAPTHYNASTCAGATFENVPLLQAYQTTVHTVKFEQHMVFHIPVCITAGPRRTTNTTIHTLVEGVIGTSAFESMLSRTHNFFPQSKDVLDYDINKQYVSETSHTELSATFPHDLYLRVEGWGGYFIDKNNRFRLTVRLSWQ